MTPKVLASFFQLSSALNWGSVLSGRSAYTPPTSASAVNGSAKYSGRRVWMSTVPATPPSTRSAVELLCTTIWLTTSDGSSV